MTVLAGESTSTGRRPELFLVSTLLAFIGWYAVTARLAQRGTVRRTAGIIGVLTGVYLLWEVATYVAIAVGPPTLLDTIGPPPFVLGLLWAGVGGCSWWSRRSGRSLP
jgi:hypothetical protein